jgi:hypothetical protein
MRLRTVLVLVLALPACGGGAASTSGSGAAGQGGSGGTGAAGPGGSGATSSGGGGTGGTGAGGQDPGPPPGNALVLPDGSVAVLYPVTDPAAGTRAVGFLQSGSEVTVLDEHGATIWKKDMGAGEMFGGFDFDADGFPDLGFVRTQDTGTPCGMQTIHKTSIELAQGKTGALFPLVPPTDSICWNFSGTIYPTDQWTSLDVLFGATSSVLATSAYYATEGTFWAWNGKGFDTKGTYQYPSTAAYDMAYPAAKPNAYANGQDFIASSHVAIGLFGQIAGEERLAFFTSSRAVEYAVEPLAKDQLRADVPWLTGGRTDIAGRNYGLVSFDPGAPDNLVLIAGTSADTVYVDMVTAMMAADPWAGIERHVAVVHTAEGTVEDRFFSYAHDNMDGNKYEGRVVFPDSPFVRMGDGKPSRLAFNVYEGGHWQLHVTKPGGAADEVVFKDMFLWDIRDLDGDGLDDWVLSPSRDPADPDVPGYYFLKWRTLLGTWDEASHVVHTGPPAQGAIPLILPAFRSPKKTTSRAHLFPALVARQGSMLALLLRGSDGKLTSQTLGPVP